VATRKRAVFSLADAAFEAFALNIGDLTDDPQKAESLLRTALADPGIAKILGRKPSSWQIDRLGRTSRDYLVVPKGVKVTSAKAFELVRVLQARREIADAEAMFRMPDIDAMQPQKGKLAGVMLEESHIPGTDKDCEWSLKRCMVKEAWAASRAAGRPEQGEGIRIAHPDTGYTDHHEFRLPGRLLIADGFNFEENAKDPRDPMTGRYPGHGTATGSVIMSDEGAPPGAASFVSGVAPKALLVPLRVKDSVIHLSFKNLCKALYFAVDEADCHVISMSLGGPFPSAALQRALQHAVQNGVIPLAAAGNNVGFVVYPARYDETIALAATNFLDRIWAGSSSGEDVDIAAPGESVWRAQSKPNGEFLVARSQGTSYATATTAGICALWLAHHGRAALTQKYGAHRLAAVFKELLMRNARRPVGWDTSRFGAGIANARDLVLAPLPAVAPAGGLQSVKAPRAIRRRSEFDWVASYFPRVDRERLRRTVARMLHTDDAGLEGALVDVGRELMFHCLLEPNAYSFVIDQSTGKSGTLSAASALRAKSLAPRAPIRGASTTLRKRLVG
jgi:hypothetical protein